MYDTCALASTTASIGESAIITATFALTMPLRIAAILPDRMWVFITVLCFSAAIGMASGTAEHSRRSALRRLFNFAHGLPAPLQRCGLRSIEGCAQQHIRRACPLTTIVAGSSKPSCPSLAWRAHMFEWRTVPAGLLLCTLAPAAWLILVPGAIADQEFGWMFAVLVLVYAAVVVRNAPPASSMPARSQRHPSTRRPPPTISCLGSCSDAG